MNMDDQLGGTPMTWIIGTPQFGIARCCRASLAELGFIGGYNCSWGYPLVN